MVHSIPDGGGRADTTGRRTSDRYSLNGSGRAHCAATRSTGDGAPHSLLQAGSSTLNGAAKSARKAQQLDHRVSLGDSVYPSTWMGFLVHTGQPVIVSRCYRDLPSP